MSSSSLEWSSDVEAATATAGAPPFEWRETVFHAEVEPYYKRLWNNEFSGVSADLADTYEETPRLALARAMAHFFPSRMSGSTEAAAEARGMFGDVHTLANGFTKKAKLSQLRDRLGDNVGDYTEEEVMANLKWDVELVAAESRTMYALGLVMSGSKLKGGYHMRGANNKYKAVEADLAATDLRIAPEIDALVKFGRGLFLFFVSFVPSGVATTLLKLIGFDADSETGQANLRASLEFGGLNAPMAAMFLIATQVFFPRGFNAIDDDLHESAVMIRALRQTLPRASILAMIDSHLRRKLSDPENCLVAAQAMVDSMEGLDIGVPTNFATEYSWCLLFCLKWDEAIASLDSLLTDADDFELIHLAMVCSAGCRSVIGREDEAMEMLERVVEMPVSDHPWNRYAQPMAQAAVTTGYSRLLAFEMLFARRELHRMSRAQHEEIERIMLEVCPPELRGANPEINAVFCMTYGVVVRSLGRRDEARDLFLEALDVEHAVVANAYAAPHVKYELAQMAYEDGDWKTSKEYLDAAAKHKSYTWDDFLVKRIKLATKQVKEHLK